MTRIAGPTVWKNQVTVLSGDPRSHAVHRRLSKGSGGTGGDRAWLVGLLRCTDYKRLIVADRFVALPAQCVAKKCAVFGRPPVRRMRYLRACPAVTRFAIVFTGGPLSKNHGCCPDAAGFNAPKSWTGVFHVAKYEKRGLPCSASERTPRIQPIRPRCRRGSGKC